MEGQYGIEDLKKVISIGAKLGNLGGKVLEDNKVNAADFVHVGDLVTMFPLMLSVDFAMVMPEAKDIQAGEADEMIAHFKAEFDIPQDNLEVTIETVLDVALTVVNAILKLVNIFSKKA
jgi:hypothetical protein